MSDADEQIHPGLLVIAGIRTQQEAEPDTGWPDAAPVGGLDRRILLQDKIWIDPFGQIHRLDELSQAYRAHIVDTLIDMDLELEMASRVRVGSDMLSGALDTPAGLRDLDAIGALGRRWVETTPLIKRLVALGGISLPERPPIHHSSAPPGGRVTELHDSDGGLWRVSTETSTYLIDLDLRMLLRAPGAVRGTHINLKGELVMAYEFSTDPAWQRLIHLDGCRLGEPMVARVRSDGREGPIRSTDVTIIELAEPP